MKTFKIKIDNYPENYLNMIYRAGRNCYGARDACSTKQDMARFTKMLIKLGHESVLEHICVSVYAKDVSRSFLAQITRHRLVSYSVKSQHYVKHFDFPYKALENWGKQQGRNIIHYQQLMERINQLYKIFIEDGIPHYIAREILPNACLTDMYMTANVREWRHIINMRASKNNTPEIRGVARALLIDMYMLMPELFEDLYKKLMVGEN